MYRIKVGTNPYLFKVDMNMVTGGAPSWDARLTLFKKVTVTCTDASGAPTSVDLARPVATVTRANASALYPVLDGSQGFANIAGTLGDLLAANSEYYLAVTGSAELPVGYRVDCNATGGTYKFFMGSTGLGQYAAQSADMLLGHMTGWDGAGVTAGVYATLTTEVRTVAASDCSSAMAVTADPVLVPFDYALAPAVSLPGVSCAPTWLTSRQYFYVWTPTCTGTGIVTTCGLTSVDTAIEVFEIDLCNPDPCAAASTTSIACNDQCGTGNSSEVEFPVTAGRQYLVWMPRVSPAGFTGSVRFMCTTPPPSADLNGDGVVNALDLGILLGQW